MVTSSKKLKKEDEKLKKKKVECKCCLSNCFDVDNFLEVISTWDGVMHLHVFLDVRFSQEAALLRYRGNMCDLNHFTCCGYVFIKDA